MVRELWLEVRNYTDQARWHWVLTDADGSQLADFEVRLNTADWRFQAFVDLTGYLSWHVAPDRQRADEARITAEVGTWIATQVLGPVAAALVDNRPATVMVSVPAEAEGILLRPLELARVGSRPLSVQDVTFVMRAASGSDRPKAAGDRLRVLGLFSLPDGGHPLNLRRERHELVKLIDRIRATRKAADVRVLQYGVTRQRLKDILEEAEGWDIIHISGHGRPGEVLLETAAGMPDRIPAADLAVLLDPARERVKLITLSACWSAAAITAEQRALLDLPVHQPTPGAECTHPPASPTSAILAIELSRRLNCAVLAMRYPVDDDFAIALSEKLYDLLADKARPLPRALGLALHELSAREFRPLSVAAPALFGATTADFEFAAPASERADDYHPADLNMSDFPPQPDRFVGRTRVMAEASQALAAQSGIPGVLLHGMPGGGKTACALELAYTHEHAFDHLVWYKAPDEGAAIEGSLTDFSLKLEQHLPGFQMAHLVHDADKLTPFLTKLTELVERRRLLLIIDNAESLLAEDANWRDDRWSLVIAALTAHTGLGRLILTSRRVPISETALRVESVDALSPDEALLLAHELPHLNALIHGEIPGINRLDAARLARRTLEMAQGHPKLLELAEGQAASPEKLARLVEAGGQAWRRAGGLPSGFFAGGETSVTGEDYLDILAAWTEAVADTMATDEQIVFQFLCALEAPDRERCIIDGIWAKLWEQVDNRPPPSLDQALAIITTYGLAAARPGTSEFYAVHPGVAAAGRDQADESLRQMIDAVAATYWDAIYLDASEAANGSTEHSALQARAGLAAIPYLMRLELWRKALTMLEGAFIRSPSRANAVAVLPFIQRINDHEARAAIMLAAALQTIDLAAAEDAMRISLDAAVARSDYRIASAASARLVDLYRDTGKLAEALDLIDEMIGYTGQAGLGPWTQASNRVQQLQVLNAMGYHGQVLDEVRLLRNHLRTLPSPPGQDEIAVPWNVRELLLATGRNAAIDLGHWDEALDLNAAQITSMRDRNAPLTEIARARFSDCFPLLRAGRTDAVLDLLIDCRQVFLEAYDAEMLGMITAAIADVEHARGHSDIAIQLEQDALRHTYLAGNVIAIAGIYQNLGIYLRNHADQPSLAFGCHLAAALIHSLTSAGHTDKSMHELGIDMRVFGAHAVPPRDLADLCRLVRDIPGTDLPGLIAKLSPDPEVAGGTLRDIIAKAHELATAPTSGQQ